MKWIIAMGWSLVFAQTDVDEIVRILDELYRSDSSRALVSMTVTTPHYERTLKMRIWSEGLDYTLVRIDEPRKEKGVSTLKRDTEMWNYLPKIKKLIRIPPSMMMSSWMGSDFTNDDLVRESSWQRDYTVSLGREDDAEAELIFIPKEDAAVTWSKVVTVFDRHKMLPLHQGFYDEKDQLVRTMVFDQVADLGGKQLPARLTLTPLTKEGHKTQIIYHELTFGVDLEDNFFSVGRLKRGK